LADLNELHALCAQVEQAYRVRFGSTPDVIAAAPGRVNLIGEHIDYNDGFVLPMAIDRYTVVAGSRRIEAKDGRTRIYSANLMEEIKFPAEDGSAPSWSRYVQGVIAGFSDRGVTLPVFDAVIGSNVPLGGGLSSSAALEVAMATLLEQLCGIELDLAEKARLCQLAEHRYAGIPCGIMDQFSSTFGAAGALLQIDCRSSAVTPIPFGDGGAVVLITNSHVQHSLADGAYAERRASCDAALATLAKPSWRDVAWRDVLAAESRLSADEIRRARHVVNEIERTREAVEAIRDSQWLRAGDLMYASHTSLRDDFEVSCKELDLLVDIARALDGVYGSRMTGGGFGGCTVTLVAPDRATAVAQEIAARYAAQTGINTIPFTSAPARGAHVVRG